MRRYKRQHPSKSSHARSPKKCIHCGHLVQRLDIHRNKCKPLVTEDSHVPQARPPCIETDTDQIMEHNSGNESDASREIGDICTETIFQLFSQR